MGRRGGRPSKLTAELVHEIVQGVVGGLDPDVAARFSGVGPSTLRRWRARGERKGTGPEAELAKGLRDAERRTTLAAAACLQKQILSGDAKAALAFLERKLPEFYAPRSPLFTLRHLLRLATEDSEHAEAWRHLMDAVARAFAKLKPFGAAAPDEEDEAELQAALEEKGLPEEKVGEALHLLRSLRALEGGGGEGQQGAGGNGHVPRGGMP